MCSKRSLYCFSCSAKGVALPPASSAANPPRPPPDESCGNTISITAPRLTAISSQVQPSICINAPCPVMIVPPPPARPPRAPLPGRVITLVIPEARVTSTCSLEGLNATSARNSGLNVPISSKSMVSRKDSTSAKPTFVAALIMPG